MLRVVCSNFVSGFDTLFRSSRSLAVAAFLGFDTLLRSSRSLVVAAFLFRQHICGFAVTDAYLLIHDSVVFCFGIYALLATWSSAVNLGFSSSIGYSRCFYPRRSFVESEVSLNQCRISRDGTAWLGGLFGPT